MGTIFSLKGNFYSVVNVSLGLRFFISAKKCIYANCYIIAFIYEHYVYVEDVCIVTLPKEVTEILQECSRTIVRVHSSK